MTPEAEELLDWIDYEGGVESAIHHGFSDEDFPNSEVLRFYNNVLRPAWLDFDKASSQFIELLRRS